MSWKVFVGVYVLVDGTTTELRMGVFCKKGHKQKILHGSFLQKCEKCGQDVEIKSVPASYTRILHDFIGDNSDKFTEYSKDDIPNLKHGEYIIIPDDKNDTTLMDIYIDEREIVNRLEPKNYQQYIYAFEAKFAEELAILREKANYVDVRFGVLVTWG